jgi:hypothetical protein
MAGQARRRLWLQVLFGALAGTLILGLSPEHALAQGSSATILGSVSDDTGGLLPGVSVEAHNLGTGFRRSVVTDETGNYRIPTLPLGDYEVEAQLAGFRSSLRSGITLTVGREAVVNFVLSIGELEDRITVVGEAPLVQTTTSEVGGLVDEQRIKALPVNNRGFERLAFFEPGVAFYHSGASDEKMIVSGSRPNQISVYMDGTDISGSNQTVGNDRLGVEAIREFRVLTHNYSAAYGKTAGGVIETVTRSGTNTFAGSVYHYHRNSALDAKNFFDPKDEPKSPFIRNQFGFSLGGPIVRDRTHFFGNYEGLRQRLGVRTLSGVPNVAARQGVLPDPQRPGQFINVAVNPAIRPYLDLYPLPNGRDFGDGTAEFNWFFKAPVKEDYATVKVDHVFSSSDSMFVRYTDNPRSSRSSRPLPGFEGFSKGREQFLTVEHKRVFSSRWLNVVRGSYVRENSESDSIPTNPLDPSLSFLPGQSFGTITVRQGLNQLGVATTAPRDEEGRTIQLDEEITYIRGRHSFKAGATFRKYEIDVVSGSTGRGIYEFNTVRDFLEGRATTFRSAFPDSDVIRDYRQELFGWYIQDDFRIRPNLTLNLGLRHEFVSSPVEQSGKMSTMRTPLDPTITLVTDDEPYYKPNPSLRNFAPRVGFAWDVFGDGKTSVRGGYGVYHNQMVGFYYTLWAARTPPFYLEGIVRSPRFPDAWTDLAINRVNVETINPSHTPMMQHYGINIQRQIGSVWVVSAGYVGNRGTHLERNSEGNLRVHQVLPDGTVFYPANAPFVNPNFNSIRIRTTDARSWYDSLQLTVNRRFRGGAQLQASYTWGKNLDTASGTQGHQTEATSERVTHNPLDPMSDKGLSAMNVEHNFVLNGVYELPWGRNLTGVPGLLLSGWGINGVATAASGIPFSAVLGFNQSRNGNVDNPPDRPNLKPGADNNPVLGGPDRYFDPTVFELQPAGTYGNLGRHTLVTPGLLLVDVGLEKKFRFGQKQAVSFRAELFNVLNRANFGAPFRSVLDANGNVIGRAGRISSTVTPARQVQLALRVEF